MGYYQFLVRIVEKTKEAAIFNLLISSESDIWTKKIMYVFLP